MTMDLEMITPTSTEELQNILYSEGEEATRTLKRNKNPESDGITAEMIQTDGERIVRQIHVLCNENLEPGYHSRRMEQANPNACLNK